MQKIWIKQKEFVESFVSSNGYDASLLCLNQSAILEIIVKVDQRRQYFKYFHRLDMSEYKEAALNGFWYIKLHPLNIRPQENSQRLDQRYDSINEKLALYIILKTLRTLLKEKHLPVKRLDELPKSYVHELIYSLTYRDISKEALILLVESMAAFLGLNPYAH